MTEKMTVQELADKIVAPEYQQPVKTLVEALADMVSAVAVAEPDTAVVATSAEAEEGRDMAQEHRVKTLVPYWDAVERGDKTFDVRRDDRGYQRGDVLVMEKYINAREGYVMFTPEGKSHWQSERKTLRRAITYVLTGGQFGIEPGYVVLGLKPEPEPIIAGTIDTGIVCGGLKP